MEKDICKMLIIDSHSLWGDGDEGLTVLVLLGCSPKLSHEVDLAVTQALLSSLRSVSFRFRSLLSS